MFCTYHVILVYKTYVVFVRTKTSTRGQRTQQMLRPNNVFTCSKALPLN